MFILNTVFRLFPESDYDSVSSSLLIWSRYFKKFPQNHKNYKNAPEKFGSTILTLSKNRQSFGLLIILIFTFSISYRQCKTFGAICTSAWRKVSIPHRKCKTTAFISFFLHHPLQNQLFSPKKYVDLFYVRIAVTRAFTGFADIFLQSENHMLRSTYFSIIYPELFTEHSLTWKMYTCKFLWIPFRGNEHSFRINGCN